MRYVTKIAAASLLVVLPIASAVAETVDTPWRVHFGAHIVDPKSNSGELAGARATTSKSTRPTISVEYMLTPAWSIEALASIPFQHEVRLAGQRAVSVKQLPPVLGVNYHFLAGRKVSPFVGVGINYTRFFDVKGRNALEGADVDVNDSWGVAWHGGVDFQLDDRWTFTVDARWMDIDSKVKVGGSTVGTAHIDPFVYGLSFGYRF